MGQMFLFIASLIILLGTIAWFIRDLWDRQQRLANAPSFHEIVAEAAQPQFSHTPTTDTWRKQLFMAVPTEPTLHLSTEHLECDVWIDRRSRRELVVTCLAHMAHRPAHWSLSFHNGQLLIAKSSNDVTLCLHQIASTDQAALNTLYARLMQFAP